MSNKFLAQNKPNCEWDLSWTYNFEYLDLSNNKRIYLNRNKLYRLEVSGFQITDAKDWQKIREVEDLQYEQT